MSQPESTFSTTTAAVNPKLVLPFLHAVREVFKTMAGVDITVGKPFLKTGAAATHGVCGIIGFFGQITGSVVVSFSDAAAESLVEAFVGTRLTRIDPDFTDAIGELANMIAGCAKGKLDTAANISTPSVILGGYTVANPKNVPCLVIPCGCVHGEFTVEVSIKTVAAVQAA